MFVGPDISHMSPGTLGPWGSASKLANFDHGQMDWNKWLAVLHASDTEL